MAAGKFSSASISKAIAAERKKQRIARQSAFGTLNPEQMRRALLKGEIDPFDAVTWGTNEKGHQFTLEDIQMFGHARQRVQKSWSPTQGAPIVQLLASSLADDIERSNAQIRSSTMIAINGATLHFNVPSSGTSPGAPASYGVRVRLEEWNDNLISHADYKDAVRRSLRGRVSIDCTCGRYQYWFRYVATAAKVALKPFEKDFPKIRNPKLVGMCCKHQLKTLKVLLTPTLAKFLEKKMAEQAGATGFLGDTKHKALTKKDMEQVSKARPRAIDQTKYQDQLKKLQAAAKTYKKKTASQKKDLEYIAELKKQKADVVAQLRKAERALEKQKVSARIALEKQINKPKPGGKTGNDTLKIGLKRELDSAKEYGGQRSQAIRFFAKKSGITLAKAKELAKGIK